MTQLLDGEPPTVAAWAWKQAGFWTHREHLSRTLSPTVPHLKKGARKTMRYEGKKGGWCPEPGSAFRVLSRHCRKVRDNAAQMKTKGCETRPAP